MAPKAAQEKQKKKAAKQKKILMILALPMIGALVYAYTTMSSLGGKTVVAEKSAASTTSAGSTPTASATAPTADTAAAPVTPGIAGVPIVALHSFTALGQKDPFHDHGPQSGAGSGASSGSSSAKGNGKGSSSSGGGSTSKQPSAPLTGAVISLNGDKLALALGAAFGHAPGLSGVSLFRLVKVTPKTALIGVVGTHQQFTLHVNHPLTLQQNGGWTYTLILEPLGTAAPMTVQPTSTTSTTIHDQQGP
jgi:hypothetical protein